MQQFGDFEAFEEKKLTSVNPNPKMLCPKQKKGYLCSKENSVSNNLCEWSQV